ncbi:MAG: hypothetical protein K5897_04325 [Eubacterium sp.]|nr:hypothetical protein [Eubacterium sp.]
MKKKRYMVVLGAALILVVTILLLFLPFGSKEEAREGSKEGSLESELSGENTSEQVGNPTGDASDTEVRQGGAEVSSEVTTANSGESGNDVNPGNVGGSGNPVTPGRASESGNDSGTEGISGAATEEVPEEVTEAPVDGAGLHQGKLGSNYSVPEGFFDISPEDHEEGYYYIYRNPERNMLLQVAEFRLEDRRVGFDGEYNVLHNLYLNDDSSYVTYDTKDDNHYVISGYLDHRTKVFFYEGYKYPDRNEVQIYSEYPNDGWKDSCDEFLDALLDSYEYHFVSDPERSRREEETTEDPYWEQYEDPSSVLDQFREQ